LSIMRTEPSKRRKMRRVFLRQEGRRQKALGKHASWVSVNSLDPRMQKWETRIREHGLVMELRELLNCDSWIDAEGQLSSDDEPEVNREAACQIWEEMRILKAFEQKKSLDKVWAVHKEAAIGAYSSMVSKCFRDFR
jgi:hypothetical protein